MFYLTDTLSFQSGAVRSEVKDTVFPAVRTSLGRIFDLFTLNVRLFKHPDIRKFILPYGFVTS
jgi:hypothetical protein